MEGVWLMAYFKERKEKNEFNYYGKDRPHMVFGGDHISV